MVAARCLHHPALDLGAPRGDRRRRRLVHGDGQVGLRAARPGARGDGVACGTTKASARRCAASRIAVSCSAAAALSPTSSCPAAPLRARALAARPRAHPPHRCGGCACGPRRRCRLHRRRHGGRRHGADAAALDHPLARRHADGRAAALRAGARRRPPCRRAGGGGDRRDPPRGRRCRRARRGRLRAAPCRHRRPRRAGAPTRRSCTMCAPGNVCFRSARGDEAATKRGVSLGRPHGRGRSRQQSPGRRGDRAARGHRHRRSRRRQAHALQLDAGAPSYPPPGRRAARHARERAARDLARRRRRLRLQGQALSRGGDRHLGGAAAGPSGALGRDPRRELPGRQPGARSSDARRARARRRRPFPRAARPDARQSRRLYLDLRRQHPERDLQRAVRRRLHARRRSSWR